MILMPDPHHCAKGPHLTQNFPKAPKMPWLWQIACCFSCIQIFYLPFEEVSDLPSPNPTQSRYPKLHFSKGVSKTGEFVVCSFLCEWCKFGGSLSWHSPQHVLHFYICAWGILICRILANEACDLQCLCHVVAKGASSDTILHPPLQNTNNPVRCAGRQPSHGNLNFAAESFSCTTTSVRKKHLLIRPLQTETFQKTRANGKNWQRPSRTMQSTHPDHNILFLGTIRRPFKFKSVTPNSRKRDP